MSRFATLCPLGSILLSVAHATAPLTQAQPIQCRPGQDIVGPNSPVGSTGAWVSSDQECDQRCLDTPDCTAWIRPTGAARSECWLVSGAVSWKMRSDRNAGTPGCMQQAADGDGSSPSSGQNDDGSLPASANATAASCLDWCEPDFYGGSNAGRHCTPGDMANLCGSCSFCGGGETCESQLGNTACNGDECATCGDRIAWLKANLGMSETAARQQVANEFPSICGACGSGSPSPPATPTPTPSGNGTSGNDGDDGDGVFPFRGICYGALPCLGRACGAPEDMAQDAYRPQWGAEGRDDLGVMKRMGANAIRLYHPIGEKLGVQPEASGFLDASKAAGLRVFGAVHQYLSCPEDDCYESHFEAVQDGLASGFARDGAWHSAVWAIGLINEVDAHVPVTDPARQVKRLISAADALFAAEKRAQIRGNVKLTSCFTTALAPTFGESHPGTVYHGFLSMDMWMQTPALVDYTPRSGSITDLAEELDRRWVHCMNAQIPWEHGLKGLVADLPSLPRPWFIGEMGFNGVHGDVIERELDAMHRYALEDNDFIGTFFFQFQTAHWKGLGPELNYGMFGLGAPQVGTTGKFGDKDFPVHCLTSRQWAFEQPSSPCQGECNHRAKAVAKAFGGEISGDGVCLEEAPLGQNSKRRRLRYDPPAHNE